MMKTTRVIAALIFCAFTSVASADGTFWRLNRAGGLPYLLQFNIDGVWRNMATVPSSATDSVVVVSNTALKALPITNFAAGAVAKRQGFYSAGDGGELTYSLSLSACSISSGAGNDFTQVAPTVGTGCWLAAPQPQGYDIRAAGLLAGDSGSNSATNGAIMTKIWALTGDNTIIVPEGLVFRLPCGTQYAASGSLKWLGIGNGTGEIKFDAGCAWTGPSVFHWDGKSNIGSTNITWNLNTPAVPVTRLNFLACAANTASVSNCVFKNNRIINGVTKLLLIASGATSGYTIDAPIYSGNYIQITPDTTQNQCIALSTNALAGNILNPLIEENTCVGSGIQVDGTNPRVINNDVSAFEFGSGIYTAAPSALPYTATKCYMAGNYIHDTGPGMDVNNTSHEGIEDHCEDTVAVNNRFINLGGGAIITFANKGYYADNYVRGVGVGCDAGLGTRTAFWLVKGVSPDANAAGNTTWEGNRVEDDGSTCDAGVNPAMLSGFRVESNIVGTLKGRDNSITISSLVDGSGHLLAKRFNGATNLVLDIDPKLISYAWVQYTTTAAVSALSWAPLDTTTFKNWYLSCQKLYPSSVDVPQVQVSQDGGGTWKTSADYVVRGREVANGTEAAVSLGTANGMQLGLSASTWASNQTVHGQFVMHCRDLDGSVPRKACTTEDTSYRRSTDNAVMQFFGAAYYNLDTNPIDGLRLNMIGANTFFGRCALRGEM